MAASSSSARDVGQARLAAQLLSRPRATAADVVAHLGAVQAQDYHACLWAVGMRMKAATVAAVEGALADGTILRTHAMRGTWQLMTPADAAWIVPLVGPHVLARAAKRHRDLGLDDATLRRASDVIARALDGGVTLGRDELRRALTAAGIDGSDVRLSHILGYAELTGVICNASGHTAGSRHTLLAHRLPKEPRRLARADAIAELARRYFTSRGPATLDDFAWWSGLPAAAARAGYESAMGSVSEVTARSRSSRRMAAYLVPAFDEYLVAYRDRADVLAPGDAIRLNAGGGMLNPCVILDGKVVGQWKRTLARTAVTVAIAPFRALAPAEVAAITRAAERYAAFHERALDLEMMKGGARDRKRRAR
jgi:hypothetical protein